MDIKKNIGFIWRPWIKRWELLRVRCRVHCWYGNGSAQLHLAHWPSTLTHWPRLYFHRPQGGRPVELTRRAENDRWVWCTGAGRLVARELGPIGHAN